MCWRSERSYSTVTGVWKRGRKGGKGGRKGGRQTLGLDAVTVTAIIIDCRPTVLSDSAVAVMRVAAAAAAAASPSLSILPLPPTVQVNRAKAPKTSLSSDTDLNFRRAIRSNPLLPRSCCRRRRRMSGFGSPYLHFRQMHGSHSPCPAARPPPKNTKSADCARAAASSTADSRKAACTEDNRIGWRHFRTSRSAIINHTMHRRNL